MHYRTPVRFHQAVLFLRDDPEEALPVSSAEQERLCRAYCAENGIPISHTVHVCCGPDEALDVMRYLIRTLPDSVDCLLACRFFCFSSRITELGKLCMLFQCRSVWVQSLEIPSPLFNQFHVLRSQRLLEADEMYRALIE